MGRTVENSQKVTKPNPGPVELGRTVEKYLKTKHKERNHKKAAHHSNPCFIGGIVDC
jgi:hypothetical protein